MLGYFDVSVIHRVLTWTTGSLTCVVAIILHGKYPVVHVSSVDYDNTKKTQDALKSVPGFQRVKVGHYTEEEE